MKQIIIFRHIACEDPDYPGDYLTSRDIPFHIICVDQGESIPEDPNAYSGFVFMGGPMCFMKNGYPDSTEDSRMNC